MKLYHHPLSGHSHRARLFAALLDLKPELVEVDLLAGEHKQPAFLALNPLGQVPVLVDDDGTVVADSNAILVYLARKLGRTDWLPDDAAGSAAHTFIGRNLAKLSDEDSRNARSGRSDNAKADAALRFAVALATTGGAVPEQPDQLRNHRIAASTTAWASPEWQFRDDLRVRIEPALLCNTNDAAINAALAGWGLTRVLDYQIGSALAEGRLQIVLEEFEPPAFPIHVLHPEGRNATAKVRAFIDLATAKLRTSRLQ